MGLVSASGHACRVRCWKHSSTKWKCATTTATMRRSTARTCAMNTTRMVAATCPAFHLASDASAAPDSGLFVAGVYSPRSADRCACRSAKSCEGGGIARYRHRQPCPIRTEHAGAGRFADLGGGLTPSLRRHPEPSSMALLTDDEGHREGQRGKRLSSPMAFETEDPIRHVRDCSITDRSRRLRQQDGDAFAISTLIKKRLATGRSPNALD